MAESSFLRLYRHTPSELPGVRDTILDRMGIAGEFDFMVDYAREGHAEVG